MEPSDEDLSPVTVVEILQALADPVRLEMVRRLRAAGDGQGCAALYDDIPKSTASYHFRVLRTSGVIHQYDAGGRRLNRLRTQALEEAVPGLLDAVFAGTDERGTVGRPAYGRAVDEGDSDDKAPRTTEHRRPDGSRG